MKKQLLQETSYFRQNQKVTERCQGTIHNSGPYISIYSGEIERE